MHMMFSNLHPHLYWGVGNSVYKLASFCLRNPFNNYCYDAMCNLQCQHVVGCKEQCKNIGRIFVLVLDCNITILD